MANNRQTWAKIVRKIGFPCNNFPETFFLGCIFVQEMAFSGKLLEGKSTFYTIFADFCRFLAIFTLFSEFSFCTVGAFLAIFPIFF